MDSIKENNTSTIELPMEVSDDEIGEDNPSFGWFEDNFATEAHATDNEEEEIKFWKTVHTMKVVRLLYLELEVPLINFLIFFQG